MKMVLRREVENAGKWLENKGPYGTISKFAKNIFEYVIESGSKIVSLTFVTKDK